MGLIIYCWPLIIWALWRSLLSTCRCLFIGSKPYSLQPVWHSFINGEFTKYTWIVTIVWCDTHFSIPKVLACDVMHTVLSVFSAPALTSASSPLKMNSFISPHLRKPLLYYKKLQILLKRNIFFAQKLEMLAKRMESTRKALHWK